MPHCLDGTQSENAFPRRSSELWLALDHIQCSRDKGETARRKCSPPSPTLCWFRGTSLPSATAVPAEDSSTAERLFRPRLWLFRHSPTHSRQRPERRAWGGAAARSKKPASGARRLRRRRVSAEPPPLLHKVAPHLDCWGNVVRAKPRAWGDSGSNPSSDRSLSPTSDARCNASDLVPISERERNIFPFRASSSRKLSPDAPGTIAKEPETTRSALRFLCLADLGW